MAEPNILEKHGYKRTFTVEHIKFKLRDYATVNYGLARCNKLNGIDAAKRGDLKNALEHYIGERVAEEVARELERLIDRIDRGDL